MDGCIFCKISKGEIPSEKIYENDNFFSVADIKPLVDGHSLVISKKHFETVLDLPSSIGQELLDCLKKTSLKLVDKFKADGFTLIQNNFEAAEQEVKHVHFHIVPRKEDDGLNLRLIDKEGNTSRRD